MARLASQWKVGYYPTPDETLTHITDRLVAPNGDRIRCLDPCAGEGAALAAVADALAAHADVDTYGVEVSPKRATAARAVLDHVINDDFDNVVTANKAYGLAYLNPPYDWEAAAQDGVRRNREEYNFLRATAPKLQYGGVLVYIVPRVLLTRKRVVKYLAGHFDDLRVWRLPDGEYEQFKQIVVMGRRIRTTTPDQAEVERLSAFGEAVIPPSIATAIAEYDVPATPGGRTSTKFFFRKLHLEPEELAGLVAASGVHGTTAWSDYQTPRDEKEFTPAVPLRRGHLAMLLASGLMGTMRLDDGVVAKGRSQKVEHTFRRERDDGSTEEVTREEFETHVRVLRRDEDGSIERDTLDSPDALEDFLTEYGGRMAKIIKRNYTPLYQESTDSEWAAVSGLIPGKKLPGRDETGLLKAQKHVTLAAARVIEEHSTALIVAEMGAGKSAMSLATIERLDAYPAIVMCPPHLPKKWAREVKDVLPGVQGVVLESIEDLNAFVTLYNAGLLPRKSVAIVARSRAKLGSGWRHAAVTRTRRYRSDASQTAPGAVQRGDGTLVQEQFWACPSCHTIVLGEEEDTPLAHARDEDGYPMLGRSPRFCHECGEALFQFVGTRGGGFDRWPLADVIRKKYKGFFKLLIADEVHDYRGKSTDQAKAFQHLINACNGRMLGLTGTFFGGRASDLFWLLYRISATVREEFAFHEERRWSRLYGRMEESRKVAEGEAGALAGTKRHRKRVKELPGVSPQIVQVILDRVIFARIADLGYDLPPYREEIVQLDLTDEMQDQYDDLDRRLRDLMQTARDTGDPGMTSVWLQTVLSRPNAMHRKEEVYRNVRDGRRKVRIPVVEPYDIDPDPNEQPITAPALVGPDEATPKEEWLVNYVRSEREQGRKVLLFVRQTGTRDIQPRLRDLLEQHGVHATILKSSVGTRRREKWIEDRLGEMDVLITNPGKVATGLDLVGFSTAVFLEPEYNLYRLWQAQRRIWRLGQTRPVKVVYAVYRDTIEEAALALISKKMKAALLVYGEDASSALAQNAGGDGNFMAELAKKVLADDPDLQADGISGILQADERETTKAWGDMTRTSPQLESETNVNPFEAWIQKHTAFDDLDRARSVVTGDRRRRTKSTDDRQLSMFELAS